MKTSWIIGVVMLYLLIFACEVFVTGGTTLAGTTSSGVTNIVTDNSTSLMSPNLQESTNAFTSAWAIATGVARYLSLIIQVLFLWCPTVFSGYMIWFWWFICFPVDCGMIFSIVTIIRGGHSG